MWPNALSLNAVEKNLAPNPSSHEVSLVSVSFQFSFQQPPGNFTQQVYQAKIIQESGGKTAERGQQVERNSGNTHFDTCLIMNLSNSLNLGLLLYFADILYVQLILILFPPSKKTLKIACFYRMCLCINSQPLGQYGSLNYLTKTI